MISHLIYMLTSQYADREKKGKYGNTKLTILLTLCFRFLIVSRARNNNQLHFYLNDNQKAFERDDWGRSSLDENKNSWNKDFPKQEKEQI